MPLRQRPDRISEGAYPLLIKEFHRVWCHQTSLKIILEILPSDNALFHETAVKGLPDKRLKVLEPQFGDAVEPSDPDVTLALGLEGPKTVHKIPLSLFTSDLARSNGVGPCHEGCMANKLIDQRVVHHLVEPIGLPIKDADQYLCQILSDGITEYLLNPILIAREKANQRNEGAFLTKLSQYMDDEEQSIRSLIVQIWVVGIFLQE